MASEVYRRPRLGPIAVLFASQRVAKARTDSREFTTLNQFHRATFHDDWEIAGNVGDLGRWLLHTHPPG